MNQFIAIHNRDQLSLMLSKLQANTTPLWGKMKPQQMVEHLIGDIEYTNGKRFFVYEGPANEATEAKYKWIYTNAEIPKNLVIQQLPVNYKYASLDMAKAQFLLELDDFESYFKRSPGLMVDHGGYGAMDYHEWVIWHGKHITHHFKQFGLVSLT